MFRAYKYYPYINSHRHTMYGPSASSDNNTASLKYTHDQVFDELSRIIESIGASAQDSDYVWDKNSNLTRFTDANNRATNFAYDSLIRFISSTDALAGVNPAIGRYISSDPIGLAGGLNTFNYANVSPVMYTDPEGLASCKYSITSHRLVCIPDNFDFVGPPAPLTVGPDGVFSGGSECRNDSSSVCIGAEGKGPIPPNNYEMIQSDKYGGSYWLKESFLDRRMCQLGLGRCEFYLHKGTGSAGCINADKNDEDTMSQWDAMTNLLNSEPRNYLTVVP